MGGCSISSFHAILCVILPCLHDRSPLCDIFSYLFCSISCFPRFCIPQWVIFTWDCTQRNVQKLWRTLQHTAGMATMIISFFTASSKASWYRQEILWEMAPEGNLFGAGSLRMNFTRGLSFFFFFFDKHLALGCKWAEQTKFHIIQTQLGKELSRLELNPSLKFQLELAHRLTRAHHVNNKLTPTMKHPIPSINLLN